MIFHTCPICHKVGILHPGEPPGTGTNWKNRCQGKAVTGKPLRGRYSFSDSWHGVAHSATELCGFPMTDDLGNEILDPFLPGEYVKLTRSSFDVEHFKQFIIDSHYKSLIGNPTL